MTQKWNTPTRYSFVGLSLVFLLFVSWQARELFKPLITAALTAYIFYPFVELLHRRFNMRHAVASRIVYFISLTLMIAVPVTLAPTLVRQIEIVATDLLHTLDEIGVILSTPFHIAGVELHLETFVPDLKNSLTSLLAPLPQDALTLLETTSRGTLWFLVIVI
ncbi:MAG: AI-2E family transporter, partial [Anaerolineales bacterium]|nr:AI-2E family transporter [Anaerolineales bacterium]